MEFRKMVMMILYGNQQKKHGCKEQIFGLCGRRREWGDMKDSIETCILPYVKQTTRASSTREAGHSKLVLWDNPVRWGGGGSVDIWQNPPQICKVISLQLK